MSGLLGSLQRFAHLGDLFEVELGTQPVVTTVVVQRDGTTVTQRDFTVVVDQRP